MVFYLFTLVVMTIVVAAILEAFLFRIKYKKALKKEDGRHSPFSTKAQIYVLEAGQLSVCLNLTCTELSSLLGSKSDVISKLLVFCHYSLPTMADSGQVLTFRGTKRQGAMFSEK